MPPASLTAIFRLLQPVNNRFVKRLEFLYAVALAKRVHCSKTRHNHRKVVGFSVRLVNHQNPHFLLRQGLQRCHENAQKPQSLLLPHAFVQLVERLLVAVTNTIRKRLQSLGEVLDEQFSVPNRIVPAFNLIRNRRRVHELAFALSQQQRCRLDQLRPRPNHLRDTVGYIIL